MMGETLEQVSTGMDCYSVRQALGVCVGIAPFNFPAMIPLWMFPLAIACGNTYVLKPSERVPGAAMLLGKLAIEAGFPPGILNIVHGGRLTCTYLCQATLVRAVSFVGSDGAGKAIFATATAHGKRAQANMGAKNHAVVMPDANKFACLSALIGAAFGAAGQRCMALSTAIFVGEASRWYVHKR